MHDLSQDTVCQQTLSAARTYEQVAEGPRKFNGPPALGSQFVAIVERSGRITVVVDDARTPVEH
jgi:hypothetical protein